MAEHPGVESPGDPRPYGSRPNGPMPPSLRYAWGLLWLQGVIWGGLALLLIAGAVLAVMAILANQNAIVGLAAEVFLAVLTAGFAAGAIVLARALARGSAGARTTAIVVEIAMTLLGVMWADGSNFSGDLVARVTGLAAAGGASLSLAAVLCLLRRSARQFAPIPGNQDGIEADVNQPPSGSGSLSCGLSPATLAAGSQFA